MTENRKHPAKEPVQMETAPLPEETQKKKPLPHRRKLSKKLILIIAALVAVIILIIVIIVSVKNARNNGKRYAEKLGGQISVNIATAQKAARVTLEGTSDFACINQAAGEQYPYLFESEKTVNVSGVTIPEWVIYIGTDGETVSEVLYYDYKQLQKYGNGVKVKNHVDASGIKLGMRPEDVQQYIGFKPLRVMYTNTGMQEAYKYYYKDMNTGNIVSYVLYVNYNDEQATSAAEAENNFILSVLTVQ